MTAWQPDELDRIAAADEVQITTARRDGSLRPWVPIWIVRAGDELYVRSHRGSAGAWYRHATEHAAAQVRAAGVERAITVDHPDEPTHP